MLADAVGIPATLELLAEECSELSYELLESSYINSISSDLYEEIADVMICVREVESSSLNIEKVEIQDPAETLFFYYGFERFAKVCSLLAKSSLKVARYLRGENPVYKDYDTLIKDLSLNISMIKNYIDFYIKTYHISDVIEKEINRKTDRMKLRLSENGKHINLYFRDFYKLFNEEKT